ncbi:hypothetical protein EI94DRAFT_1738276 [Lactarius quietus]|nr:hypothetical protein EI94DRAFT_1738276 [Lactarius quietus]
MHHSLFLFAAFQLAVTFFLPNVLLISATLSPSQPDIQRRGPLPQLGWVSAGCWTDDPSLPALTSYWHRFSDNMTICGGSDRLSIYWDGTTQSVNDWRFQGCYNDTNTARVLTVEVPQNNTSVESCTEACHAGGYSMAGLEFAQQCFCDHAIQNHGQKVDSGHCVLACYGNTTEICGGVDSLVVYNYIGPQ